MPYPRRLLNEGEEIALDLKPHWWFFYRQILTGTLLVVLLVLVFNIDNQLTWWAWAVLALVWAGWLGLKYLEWNFTHFVVTSHRVVFRTGVLAKRGVEIPLDRVNNINFQQGILDRVLGAGSLEIESAGQDGESRFTDVRHPDAVQQEIYRQIEANARRRASWVSAGSSSPPGATGTGTPGAPERSVPAGAPPAGIPEQIRQLAELRDRGLITAAEFETKKAQLLDRM